MSFGKIKNNALYELKYGLIDNAKRFKKTAIELKDFAGRAMLYMELAEYGVELPKEPDELTEITELDLSNKGIDKLPAGIGHLPSLSVLFLSGNNFTKFPKEIENLTLLTVLDLSRNNLSKIPKEIETLNYLTYLNLSHNNLTKLPKQIGTLNFLSYFDLSHNNLTKLPKQIADLNYLIELNLNYNNIRNTDFISRIQRRCRSNKDNEDRIATILKEQIIQRILDDHAHLGITKADFMEEFNKYKSGK